jgi:hypothetical protein
MAAVILGYTIVLIQFLKPIEEIEEHFVGKDILLKFIFEGQ